MKAYVIEQPGGPEVLQLRDISSPEPGAEDVQIRVRAFGLNRAEVYRRQGRMGPISGQVVPGIEAVGEVIRDPSGMFRTGQRVATAMGGLQFSRNGSYAEQVTVLRQNLISLDGSELSWEELAALPEAYLGLAAVTYAKARGVRVIATTRSVANRARLQQMGADEVVIDTGEIAGQVREIAPHGVNGVLEVVGAATLRDSIKTVQPFAGVSVVGLLGGPPVIEQFQLMQDLPAAVRLNFFPSGLLGTPAMPLQESPLPWIAGEVEAGRMPSLRSSTFDFDDVRRAHSLMESDRALGKFVVRL